MCLPGFGQAQIISTLQVADVGACWRIQDRPIFSSGLQRRWHPRLYFRNPKLAGLTGFSLLQDFWRWRQNVPPQVGFINLFLPPLRHLGKIKLVLLRGNYLQPGTR